MHATLEKSAPSRVGSRDQARALFSDVDRLHGAVVILDCSELRVSAPSFVDEVVRVVLVEAEAAELVMVAAPARTVTYAERAAELRGVSERLVIRA